MIVEENPLDRLGNQDHRVRLTSLNTIALLAARNAARSLATPSRIDIPHSHRAAFVDLSDEDLYLFAKIPLFVFSIGGIAENHRASPASELVQEDCEILRRFISIAKDATRSSIASSKVFLRMSVSDADIVNRLSDDDSELLVKSSRISISPRFIPAECYRNKDSIGWDHTAILRAIIIDLDKLLMAAK